MRNRSSHSGTLCVPTTLSRIDLQRPRRGQAHRRLDEHGEEDDHERPRVGPQQLAHEPHLRAGGGRGSWRGRPGDGGCGGGFGGHGKAVTRG